MENIPKPIPEATASSAYMPDAVSLAALRAWYDRSGDAPPNAGSFGGLFRVLSLEMWMRAFSL